MNLILFQNILLRTLFATRKYNQNAVWLCCSGVGRHSEGMCGSSLWSLRSAWDGQSENTAQSLGWWKYRMDLFCFMKKTTTIFRGSHWGRFRNTTRNFYKLLGSSWVEMNKIKNPQALEIILQLLARSESRIGMICDEERLTLHQWSTAA